MDRRELLGRFGGLLAVGSFGGCLAQSGDDTGAGGGATTRETTERPTTVTDRTTTTEETTDGGTTGATTRTTESGPTTDEGRPGAIAATELELLGVECGEPTSEASVAFADGGSSVVVSGTIPGSNGCYLAKLVEASYDSETRTLDVTVSSAAKEGSQVCTQCIVKIDYEATVSVSGDGPERVTVTHSAMGESKTVATADSS
ncbi:hypothetical protein [Halorussus salinus]|uniref:hypothetical protein n=1 Tax=Halorussus salinus TaxID=1364935 RepID=UPI001092CC69|nr:hypothetical protein [Halorussus salinus]